MIWMEAFDHPPYIPNLANRNFYLFIHLKEFLGGKHFRSDDDLQTTDIMNWQQWSMKGSQMFMTRYNKCLNIGSDYMEK